jgi:hypothetical protein
MLKNRLFYFLLSLNLMGLFIINPFLFVPKIVSNPAPSQPAMQVTGEFCPFTAQEFQTLHNVYYKDINVRMLETSDGPIGYDGGTFALSQCRISK